MALFNRQKGASDIPPELQPYYDGTTEKSSNRGWLRWLVRGGIALAILVLLALGGTWIWNKVTGDDDAKSDNSSITDNTSDDSNGQTSSTSTTTPATPNPNGPTSSSSSAASETKPESTSNQSGSSAASTDQSSQATPEQLANTGPRETVALFLISAVTGTAIFQYLARRRQSNV